MSRPILAVTLGDPGGIGPEIVARALADRRVAGAFTPVVYGARAVWRRACELVGVPDELAVVASAAQATGPSLVSVDESPASDFPYAAGDARSGLVQLVSLQRAADDLAAGFVDGLCTAPITKHSVCLHEPAFVGHTEWLQQRFGVPRVVMLMAGPRLRVALATTHVALREVPDRLTVEGVAEICVLTARELQARFGLASPRLAVCGLNPHAGEQGRFGDEEARIITPAIELARRAGVDVQGPFPADGLFARVLETRWDAVVAMYHDQGLGPFKLLEGHDGVNVTLGLPRPRTSPDHGVAWDIAGQGRAEPGSMLAALELCASLSRPAGPVSA